MADKQKVTAVILAAGQGTRMRSALPKVLHPLLGRPLLLHSIHKAAAVSTEKPIVVIGHHAGEVRAVVGDEARFALQDRQLGTANAVAAAAAYFTGDQDGLILTLFGDMPLLRQETLQALVDTQRAHPGSISMTTVCADDPHGFGRVIRDPQGSIRCIVEEAVATPEQLAVRELNVGAYCFPSAWLWQALPRIAVSPKGEYYLTDLVEIAVHDGLAVHSLTLADMGEALGINNRAHLAEAETILRRRVNHEWMLNGVTLIDPAATYIDLDARIAADTVIYPNTHILGSTTIASGCQIGPNTHVVHSTIEENCKIIYSYIEGAVVQSGAQIGPYAYLTGEAGTASDPLPST